MNDSNSSLAAARHRTHHLGRVDRAESPLAAALERSGRRSPPRPSTTSPCLIEARRQVLDKLAADLREEDRP